MEGGQGYFDVAFIVKDGFVQGVVMGDHFGPDERTTAMEYVSDSAARAFASGTSPLFLVPDAVVKMAYETGMGEAPLRLSPCRSGPRRKPCGNCEECERARDMYFNDILLNAVDFCGDEFAERVRDSVLSVLGGLKVSVPWEGPMGEDEVHELMDAMRNWKGMKNGTKSGESV